MVMVVRPLYVFASPRAVRLCGATTTAISKRTLDVQTKMTDSIFLEPVTAPQRTVLVEVRNTSDRTELDIGPAVRAALAARGYRLVDDPRDAQFLLQANVLQVGRTSRAAAEGAFAKGFGSALVGGPAPAWAAPRAIRPRRSSPARWPARPPRRSPICSSRTSPTASSPTCRSPERAAKASW